ncbi:MAG TPA: YceI family protein [Nannocystaceae bacterium]|nr:YceI family protein [Nannocystaceae bacterium]
MNASALVFTFKDGLLARLAHDLQIRATDWEIVVDGDAVRGRFALAGLRVDGAVEHGRLALGVLSTGDKAKIERTMADDVLELRRFPTATFEGALDRAALRVTGKLTLHGRTFEVAPFVVREDGDRLAVEVAIAPSRWGIAPYRTLAGALKLQDRVVVRLSLPRGDGLGGARRWALGEP